MVLNLSSWGENKQPIAEWLIEELNTKYYIPERIAQLWVDNDELLLLLDGLDEVALSHREDCVKEINDFLQAHLVPLVVCSRVEEYDNLITQLKLHGAVVLQPLTPQQVDTYLATAGNEFQAVRDTLQSDANLQILAQSPLM